MKYQRIPFEFKVRSFLLMLIPCLLFSLSANAQNVGLGTTTPETKLHIESNSNFGLGQVKLTETQYDFARITFDNNIHPNYWDISARSDTLLANSTMKFYHSDGGDILTVNALGRIGINDATPSYPLDINGDGKNRVINVTNQLPTTNFTTFNYGVRSNLSQLSNDGFPRLYNFYGITTDNDSYLTYGFYGWAAGASLFNYGIYGYAPTLTGFAGYFSGNTYATGTYQTSDPKLKQNMQAIGNGLSIIMEIEPLSYQFKREEYDFMNLPHGEHFGVSANQVKEVLPNLVKRAFHAYDEPLENTAEGQGMWFDAVNYVEMIPILISAVQEQQKLIEDLRKEVEELKKK